MSSFPLWRVESMILGLWFLELHVAPRGLVPDKRLR